MKKYQINIRDIPENVTVKLNTLEFVNGENYTGTYYKEAPSILTYQAADGYTLDYWLINGVKYYDEQMVLDSNVTGAEDCNITIAVKKQPTDAKIKKLVWGGIARYIDVYNPGTESISLAEYTITSNEKENYHLPNVVLQPDESVRVYFSDDKSASRGDFICGVNLKEKTTVYIKKNGTVTDKVYVPEYIEGYMLGKSAYDGSWKYVPAEEGVL